MQSGGGALFQLNVRCSVLLLVRTQQHIVHEKPLLLFLLLNRGSGRSGLVLFTFISTNGALSAGGKTPEIKQCSMKRDSLIYARLRDADILPAPDKQTATRSIRGDPLRNPPEASLKY